MRTKVAMSVGGGAVALTAVFFTPHVLRHVPFFQVRQVELVGVRYYAPDDVLQALGLRDDLNVFDSKTAVAAQAMAIPGIVNASVERRLPATLRISVRERVPVALAPGPEGFVLLDRNAKPLPYDPARSDLDLPVVSKPDTTLTGTLALVRAVDPDFFDEIQDARRDAGGAVVVTFDRRRVLFDPTPSADAIQTVADVRRQLAREGRSFTELDARFNGWVVVRGRTG